MVAGVAAVGLFAVLARRMAPTPGAGALAAWLFLGGVMSNVVIGRMPFTLGIALAVGAWACARRSRARGRRALARQRLGEPGRRRVPLRRRGRAARRRALRGDGGATGAPRSRSAARRSSGGLPMALLFPEGGSDHFVGTAFWPMLLVCLGALALVDPTPPHRALGGRDLRRDPRRRVRDPELARARTRCAPASCSARRCWSSSRGPRAPRAAIAVVAVALLYLQWLPAVRAVEEARGDPSTAAAFHQRGARLPRRPAPRPGERLEVPLTRNHWEATYLAQDYPLARGWHRQLDRKVNPLFYDRDHPLDAERYERWLRKNAVRWVALPNAPLDFSARIERGLLLDGLPYLKPVHASPNWQIWEVRDPEPPVSGAARLTAAGADGFDLEATRPGPVIVRQHGTPYWTVAAGDGCVSEDHDTGLDAGRRARGRACVRVRARFSAAAALRREPRCGRRPAWPPVPHQCGQPPCRPSR